VVAGVAAGWARPWPARQTPGCPQGTAPRRSAHGWRRKAAG
jgi:hypothetical protein